MRYRAIATDYDGTLAEAGKVDAATMAALGRARAAHLCLLLVSGRELTDLFDTFPDYRIFDRIVAENGAVLCDPSSGEVRALAETPPPALVARLNAENIPLSVGRSIVATVEPYEQAVLSAIRELGLEWHVIFNKGAVMALPAGVTKATGLYAALAELGIDPKEAIGIGDAENDHAFLSACGLPVAVANAIPALKKEAGLVTVGARGAGVAELIDRLLRGELE